MLGGDDANLAIIAARLEQLLPEISRRYWHCVSWGVAAFALVVLSLLAAFPVAGNQEPATGIIVVIGCGAAVLVLSRAWLLSSELLPPNRERTRRRLERPRLS
ncbi:MAG TPA: hypothetical protein VNF24_05885 [Candidatus Acidoferrales bacterium]|nr:hypothetical protein [Candidatus Acidoferrales bacterium]